MADKYIGDITKKTPNLADYLVAVDGADAYQTLVSDVAKKIIEDYQGSNLGGVAQSIQAGFDVVSTNNLTGANNRQGWTTFTTGQDLNSVTSVGIYYANSAGIYNSVLNPPMTGKPFRLDVQYSIASNSYIRQIWTANTGEQFIRESINVGSTWSEWRLTPTRSEVNAIANQGAKNLLQGMSGNSVTSNGITATKNADGSITLNGTATANFILVVGQFENTLNGERMTLTGCPEGGSGTTYVLRAYNEGTTIQNDYGSGVSFLVPNTNNFNVRIVIFKNTTVTDLTFYPMMRFESVQDDTYVPYGMSNAELTETGAKMFAIAGNGTKQLPNNDKKYYIFAWTVANNYGGVNLLYVQSNNLNAPLIATRGEGNAPSITLEDGNINIKNNNTNTYMRCVLVEALTVLP